MTEREETGFELLLTQPELVAWLGLSEPELVAWLKPLEASDDDDEPVRVA